MRRIVAIFTFILFTPLALHAAEALIDHAPDRSSGLADPAQNSIARPAALTPGTVAGAGETLPAGFSATPVGLESGQGAQPAPPAGTLLAQAGRPRSGAQPAQPNPGSPPGYSIPTLTSVIYDDALQSGWGDWGFSSKRNFSSTDYVYRGKFSVSVDISMGMERGEGAGFSPGRDPANASSTKDFTDLSFWANGGPVGGQTLRVWLRYNDEEGNRITLNEPLKANTWSYFRVSLAELRLPGEFKVDRVYIQCLPASETLPAPKYYVDDMLFIAAPPMTTTYAQPAPQPAYGSPQYQSAWNPQSQGGAPSQPYPTQPYPSQPYASQSYPNYATPQFTPQFPQPTPTPTPPPTPPVNWLSDFDRAMGEARIAKKPMLLYFYSDKIARCAEVEQKVFQSDSFNRLASNYICFREHCSATNTIYRKFNVFLLPTLLVVDKNGNAVKALEFNIDKLELLTLMQQQ